jgi:NDP-4-keto-2,6-dideoxyhexose 3-C-methyltransferase
MFREIAACRLCGNPELFSILHMGEQYLTGVFPKSPDQPLSRGPLELVKCHSATGAEHCGLVQLRQSYDLGEMYGPNYGYRSSLNKSMIAHLADVYRKVTSRVSVGNGDLVLDIGSNDGTLLSNYPAGGATLVGMDPSAERFRKYYRPDTQLVVDFFPQGLAKAGFGERKAKIITSIAMFYDLEEPLKFSQQVADLLDDEGVWHFEQSYLPTMLEMNSYDTICHEHVEYYALRQIKWITDRVGLKIIDVELNDINGGSFAITVAKQGSKHQPAESVIRSIIEREQAMRLDELAPFESFKANIERPKQDLLNLLDDIKARGETVIGYGASTKGNVILQYCGITTDRLPCIAEVNEDKFGCHTPGTNIPIISEAQARETRPDYYLVLPWHFRENLIKREAAFLAAGGKMIFPLPNVEVVSG